MARVPAPARSMSVRCWEDSRSCGGPDLQPWLEKEKAAFLCNLQGPGRKAGAAPAAVGLCGSLSLMLLPEAPGSSSPNIHSRMHARAWSCETARSALVHPISCPPGKTAWARHSCGCYSSLGLDDVSLRLYRATSLLTAGQAGARWGGVGSGL